MEGDKITAITKEKPDVLKDAYKDTWKYWMHTTIKHCIVRRGHIMTGMKPLKK